MLTDTQCRKAPPKDRPYKLTDSRGLTLRVEPSGSKHWRYRYELPNSSGKRAEGTYAIGEYSSAPAGESPEQASARRAAGRYTLAEARTARDGARGLVRQGINPSHHRKLDRARQAAESATTFELVAREWLQLKDWLEITKKRRLDMLTRVVFPKIGALPTRQVTSAAVLDVLRTAAEKNGPSVVDEAKRTMLAVFGFAMCTLRAEINPVLPLGNLLPSNKTQHKRALSSEEIGNLLVALENYDRNFQTVAVFKLMWLTLCRPNEVVEARWNEIDLDAELWCIPPERMKMRKEHVVPLPRQATDLLRRLYGLTGHLDCVFPNRDDRSKPMTDAALRQALKNLGWSGKYSPHATRTTGSTRLNELGYNGDWVERQLAHADKDRVKGTYNHAQHLDDRRVMMQAWADFLDTTAEKAKSRAASS